MLAPRGPEGRQLGPHPARQRPHLEPRAPNTTLRWCPCGLLPPPHILLYMLNGVWVHICWTGMGKGSPHRVHIESTSGQHWVHICWICMGKQSPHRVHIGSTLGPHCWICISQEVHTESTLSPHRVHIGSTFVGFVFANRARIESTFGPHWVRIV